MPENKIHDFTTKLTPSTEGLKWWSFHMLRCCYKINCSYYYFQYKENNVVNLLPIVYPFVVTLRLFECLKNIKVEQKTKSAWKYRLWLESSSTLIREMRYNGETFLHLVSCNLEQAVLHWLMKRKLAGLEIIIYIGANIQDWGLRSCYHFLEAEKPSK